MIDHEPSARILVVDDRPGQIVAFSAALSDLGAEVVAASSGRDALRLVLKAEFAVILLDINMPGMDGFETAELIRAYRASRHTPIIFITATGDDLHRERSYAIGAVDYVLTPVSPEVLRTKVGIFVELYRKTRELERRAESMRRHAAKLHELNRASLGINAARSIDGILCAVAEAARSILRSRRATMTIALDPAPDRRRAAVAVADRPTSVSEPSTAATALQALVFAEGAAVRLGRDELAARPAFRAALAAEGDATSLLGAPIAGADGRVIGLVAAFDADEGGFSEDDEAIAVQLAQLASIALENAVQAEAREANRLKDEFLATLSHELRTPLSVILGWTRILRAGPIDPTRATRGLDVIERNVAAQVRLIDELLDISRITAGKLRIDTRALPIRPLVEAAVEALRPDAEAKDVALKTSLDEGACDVLGDADRLAQVVSNVLGNALKFTPRGGRIEVRLARVGDQVELSVSDTGEGISAEFLPFVFERFRQGDSTSTRKQGGLGIGLAVVRHIVELHGGRVRAESAGRGRGATFVITLHALADSPIVAAPPREGEGEAVTRRSGSEAAAAAQARAVVAGDVSGPCPLGGLKLVLVEDEADARELLRELLMLNGADVVAVGSVREALEAIAASPPDVLVSDLAMPGEDGYALIRRLREWPPELGGAIPALALTAYARAEDRTRALAAGFQMHAVKPIEPVDLVAAVLRLAARPPALPRPARLSQDAAPAEP